MLRSTRPGEVRIDPVALADVVGAHPRSDLHLFVGVVRQRDPGNGTGFDPAIVAQYVADGHIGLGSLLARFDAMGGAMEINSRIGYDTQVTVTSPREPVASSGE